MITAAELTERLELLAEKFVVPGAAAAVLHDGLVTTAVTGTTNVSTGSPVLPQTLFAAGSITKVFTASLIMTLVDEGALDLDRPVQAYLPEFRLADPDRSAAITTRMLLNHSSGAPGNYMPDLEPGTDVLARLMDDLRTLPVTGTPGDLWSYSNMGMSILGRIAEVLTGQTYDEALAARILQPLGLNATADAEDMLLRSTAVGHLVDPVTGIAEPTGRLRAWPENAPAGSRLWLDIAALISFGQMHLDGRAPDGRQVLSPEALRAMQDPQYEDLWAIPMYENFGLGWAIHRAGDDPVFTHGGGNIGMHSTLFVIPRQRVVIAALTNSTTGSMLHSTLSAALLDDCFGVGGPAPVVPPATEDTVDAERFTGTYSAVHGTAVVDIRDGRLHLQMTPAPTLAATERLMGIATGSSPEPLPLRTVDGHRLRFLMEMAPGAFMPVEFRNTDNQGRPTLVRVGTAYERRLS